MKHLTLPVLLCTAALLLTACAQPAASSVPESVSSAAVSSEAETSSAPTDTDTLQPIEFALKDYLRTSGSVDDLTGTRVPVEEVIALIPESRSVPPADSHAPMCCRRTAGKRNGWNPAIWASRGARQRFL